MSIIAHRVKVGFICAKKFQNQGVFIRKISGFGVQSQTGVYMNIIEILKEGRHYMERWPEEPLLNPVFPECRAKKLMSLAKRVIPPFMVLVIGWTLYLGGYFKGIPLYYALTANLSVTVCSMCVLIMIPLQGYYWFYRRSKTQINDRLKKFYQELCSQLDREASFNPTFLDFENVLIDALKKLDHDFLKKL